MVYTTSLTSKVSQMVLSMKTMLLLWLHTTFKWTAQQGLPQSTGLWDLDGGQNSGKYSKRRALCAPSSSVCFELGLMSSGTRQPEPYPHIPVYSSHVYVYVPPWYTASRTTSSFSRTLLLRNIIWNPRMHTSMQWASSGSGWLNVDRRRVKQVSNGQHALFLKKNLKKATMKIFNYSTGEKCLSNSGCSLIIQLVLPSHSTMQDCLEFRSSTEIKKDENEVGVCVCLCVCAFKEKVF